MPHMLTGIDKHHDSPAQITTSTHPLPSQTLFPIPPINIITPNITQPAPRPINQHALTRHKIRIPMHKRRLVHVIECLIQERFYLCVASTWREFSHPDGAPAAEGDGGVDVRFKGGEVCGGVVPVCVGELEWGGEGRKGKGRAGGGGKEEGTGTGKDEG